MRLIMTLLGICLLPTTIPLGLLMMVFAPKTYMRTKQGLQDIDNQRRYERR